MRHTDVIILNADYTFLNIVSWKEAVCLLVKGAAKPVDSFNETTAVRIAKIVKTVSSKYLVPLVMRLVTLVRKKFRTKVPWNKQAIYLRDNYTCQYCGKILKDGETTIDHVVPKSRGGKSTFENCVTACKKCNSKKNNRLPSDCGLSLRVRPVQPTITEYTNAKLKKIGVYGILKEVGLF